GAGRIAGREVHRGAGLRGRANAGGDHRRLRTRDERRLSTAAGGARRRARAGGRHHHYDRTDPRQTCTRAPARRDYPRDEAGLRRRRPGRRAGRQLPADGEGSRRRKARRHARRLLQPAGDARGRCQRALRAQRAGVRQSARRPENRRAQHQPDRRNHRRGARLLRRKGLVTGVIDHSIVDLTVFVLAVFVGYHVVWNVTPALHTPLMSVTNAISSVIVVGAILAAGPGDTGTGVLLGTIAVALAAVNTFGGFLVSQ